MIDVHARRNADRRIDNPSASIQVARMFPHFLGIGAPRTGTTWLHTNLARHPKVWMPPMKEIHYFDRPDQPLGQRLRGRYNNDRNARERLLGALTSAPWKWRRSDVFWLSRFLLLPRSDDWYRSLFPVDHVGLVGEITPSYARLGEERVEWIHSLMPDSRMIYFLRNPIEMAWSMAVTATRHSRRRPIQNWPAERVIRRVTAAVVTAHADYAGNLERWEKIYGPDRILIAFHEDLKKDPLGLYRRVLAFLDLGDVDDQDVIVEPVNQRSVAFDSTPYLPAMAAHYRGAILRTHQRFQNAYTAEWVEKTERILRDRPA